MSTLDNYKPNELEMALRIAVKAIDQLIEQKPNGGLVVNRGQDTEAKMRYSEAKVCLERIQRRFSTLGAFSLGICGDCSRWDTRGHGTSQTKWDDYGTCNKGNKSTHRYDSCDGHSKKNGGWGL